MSDSDRSEIQFPGKEDDTYASEVVSHAPKPLSHSDLNQPCKIYRLDKIDE